MSIRGLAMKTEKLSFDQIEKKILDNQASKMLAIEFYKSLVGHFKLENVYSIRSSWGDVPSLTIQDKSPIEFSFGNEKLRIVYGRCTFVVNVDDNYIQAIEKILAVFDYVETSDEEKQMKSI
jgi:hypothetical protein